MPTSTRAKTAATASAADYWMLAKSFERSLLAANRSPGAIRVYTISVQQFGRFLEDRGMPLHPHLFRHGYAHTWLAQGGQEQDLMMLAGWRSRTMLVQYGASAPAERAREAYRRLSLEDRL